MPTLCNGELRPFKELARTFAARELAGKAAVHDRFPCGDSFGGVLEKAFKTGFLGIMLSPELGGAGSGIGALCAVLREICRVDASLGGIIFTNALVQELLRQAQADCLAEAIFGKAAAVGEALAAFPSYADPSHIRDLPEAAPAG